MLQLALHASADLIPKVQRSEGYDSGVADIQSRSDPCKRQVRTAAAEISPAAAFTMQEAGPSREFEATVASGTFGRVAKLSKPGKGLCDDREHCDLSLET